MADVRNYTVNYNITSNSAQAKGDLERFVAELKAGSTAAKEMALSMSRISAAQKTFAQGMGKAFDMRAPMAQMEAFQASAANMIRNISKSFTAMATGNASELEKALGKLGTQGFTRVGKDWNTMLGTMRSEMKSTGKVLSENEKVIRTSMGNIANAYQLLDKEGQLGVMSEAGRKRAFSKGARALYADLKERGALTKKGIQGYIDEQTKILNAAQEKASNEQLRAAKTIAAATGNVFQDTKNYVRGLNLTGNFNEQAEQFRKTVNSINRLAKISGIGDKSKFAITMKLSGVDVALRQINTLDTALRKLKADANIQVKVSTKGASKNFTQGIRDLRGMLTQANKVINSVVAGDAKGLLKIPAIAEVVGSEKGTKPVPIEGVIEKVVNAAKKVAGEVPVDGVVEFVKAAKKVAGEVGVNGIVEFVKGAKKVMGEVNIEGIVTAAKNANNFLAKVNSEAFIVAAKNAEGFLAKVNAEAFITNAVMSKGIKPVPLEVIPQIKSADKVTKALTGGKPIPVSIRPEWHKDSKGKTAIDSLVSRVGKKLPPIELTLNTEKALAKFREFIAEIRRFKEISINLNARATAKHTTPKAGGTTTAPASGGTGGTTTMPASGRRGPTGMRSVSGRRFSTYPLVGNTSFGVQTPAFVSMAKGMVGMMGIGAAFGLIGDAMRQAVEYQNTMMSVKAILESNKRYTGYTPENFREMEKNIRRVGMDTKFTAPEVAGAARFMAMAGLSVDQINNSIRPIADVALIGDNDLETTADKITNIQTAFRLGKDPKSMRKLADNLTTTFTRFNTDMMMTAEAMQYAAPVASAAGLGIEDTLAMIGVMGNAGIQSSMAGTTLRMAMQNIIKPNKRQKALWDKLGISRHNADGSPRNIVDVLTELRAKTSDAQLMEVVSNLFRTTSMAGTVQIVRNLDLLKSAREDMILGRDMGLSSKLSAEKQNTIKGLWAQVTSAFTEDNVLMFEKFQGKLKEMLVNIRDYLKTPEAVQNLEHIMELIKTMGSAFGTVVRVWMNLYNTFPGAVKAMMIMQFAMSQIGLLLNPFIGLFRVARNMGIATGVLGTAGAGAAGVAGARAVGAAGSMAGLASTAVASRYISRYGMGSFARRTFGASFTAARTAGALSLGGLATSGLSGLGTLLGSLLSPIGLTLAGIAATVAFIAVDRKKKSEIDERFKRKAIDNYKHYENARNILNNKISGDQFDKALRTGVAVSVGDISVPQSSVNTSRYIWKSNPQLRHTKGISSIFDSEQAKANPNNFIDEMYRQFIEPTGMSRDEYYKQIDHPEISESPFLALSHKKMEQAVQKARILAIEKAVRMQAINTPFYRESENKVIQMFAEASSISDKNKRMEAFANARKNATEYVNSLRPNNGDYQHLTSISFDKLGMMKNSEFANTWVFRKAISDQMQSLLNGDSSSSLDVYFAIEKLDKLGANEFQKRAEILAGITKAVEFQLPDANGVLQNLKVQFDSGKASYEQYIAILDAFNIQTGRDIQTYFSLVSGAIDKMLENPLLSGFAAGTDKGDIMRAKLGLTAGSTIDKQTMDALTPIAKGYAATHGIDWNWWNQRSKNGKGRIWTNTKDLSDILEWRYPLASKKNGTSGMKDVTGKTTGDGTTGTGGTKGTAGTYTPDQSGYANHYQRSAARPTQINLNIQNLVNIDKTEFKSMDERELLSKLEFVVAQASTQLASTAAAQISALGSTSGDTQEVG